jgi:hypothetical protein
MCSYNTDLLNGRYLSEYWPYKTRFCANSNGLSCWTVRINGDGARTVMTRYINQEDWMDCVKTTQNITSSFYLLLISQLDKFKFNELCRKIFLLRSSLSCQPGFLLTCEYIIRHYTNSVTYYLSIRIFITRSHLKVKKVKSVCGSFSTYA